MSGPAMPCRRGTDGVRGGYAWHCVAIFFDGFGGYQLLPRGPVDLIQLLPCVTLTGLQLIWP